MKITVIGGGSSYTPELINGFLERIDSLPVSELWLMDVLPERLDIVGGFAQRMVEAKGSPFRVYLSTDQRQAVRDASYVTTQLRVGWMQARREDEYLGRRHGLIGQETTGVGGMAKALRTIPVILSIADDMREVAQPGAHLINFTNPAGLVTEALSRYAPDVPSAGVCNVALHTVMNILDELREQDGIDVDRRRAMLNTLGLNHLTWHRGFTIEGEEIWPRIMERYIADLRASQTPEWDVGTIETLQMIPNYYLQYFYYTDKKLAEQEQWPPSRVEAVMAIEEELLAQYAEPDRTEPPEGLMQRGGAYYSTVATQLLDALYNDLQETHVVNVPHGGAVPDWPEDWVLEMPCRVGRDGIVPLPAEPLPPACFGLLSEIKMYELLTVEAAVHGDRDAAFQALLSNPLGPPADQIDAVLDDMLATHRAYLPRFLVIRATNGEGQNRTMTMRYFLGVDVGNTKSHALIADETGKAVGFGTAGMGSWEGLGWEGAQSVVQTMVDEAMAQAGIELVDIMGAGFGFAGYDWPEDRDGHIRIVDSLGLVNATYDVGNDVVVGLFAGADQGWGVVVSAGTSNNCYGRNQSGQTWQMTGAGTPFAEYGGAAEIVRKAVQAVSLAWSMRGPSTALSDAFVAETSATDVDDLFAGLIRGRYQLQSAQAPIVFEVASSGDPVANNIIRWAGRELGSLAIGAIRHLELGDQSFDLVLSGTLFRASEQLASVMGETVHAVAPHARLVRLDAPPVTGGVIWGMHLADVETLQVRSTLFASAATLMAGDDPRIRH